MLLLPLVTVRHLVSSNTRRNKNPKGNTKMQQARLDGVFEVLTHSERRKLLVALANKTSDGISIDSSEMPESRWIELNHVHLPKLDDLGFVTWDAESHVITKGLRFKELQPMLSFIQAEMG